MKTTKTDAGYVITDGDWTFHAIKDGTKFKCGLMTGDLKSIKILIAASNKDARADLFDGVRDSDSAACEEVLEDETIEVGEQDTWSCVHPCALLILQAPVLDKESFRTLDAYGWMMENGCPNEAKAVDEYHRWKMTPEEEFSGKQLEQKIEQQEVVSTDDLQSPPNDIIW